MNNWIGLDIGGANIKVALNSENEKRVFSVPFALWKQPAQLISKLQTILQSFAAPVSIAVTMTGELADCFSDRQSGVHFIVDAMEKVAVSRDVIYYSTGGTWFDAETAKVNWQQVAAANWHAISNFASRFLTNVPGGNGFLIDMGSTTIDIIPIRHGKPAASGLTDFDRLTAGELVYVGVQRTPLCGLASSYRVGGKSVSIAREFFATTADVFLILQRTPENPHDCETADGRPATRTMAMQRLSRMVCSDASLLGESVVLDISLQVSDYLTQLVSNSLQAVIQANSDLPLHFVISGQGEWFLRTTIQQLIEYQFGTSAEIVSLAERLGAEISQAAAAYAVAFLAAEKKM